MWFLFPVFFRVAIVWKAFSRHTNNILQFQSQLRKLPKHFLLQKWSILTVIRNSFSKFGPWLYPEDSGCFMQGHFHSRTANQWVGMTCPHVHIFGCIFLTYSTKKNNEQLALRQAIKLLSQQKDFLRQSPTLLWPACLLTIVYSTSTLKQIAHAWCMFVKSQPCSGRKHMGQC